MHQLVFAQVVLGGDQRFAVGDQVLHAHALEPGVPQGLGHGALKGDGVAKGGADGQQSEDIAVAQGLRQALGIEHQVLHLAGRSGLVGVDALNQGFLDAGQNGDTTAQQEDVLHGGAVFQLINGTVVGGTGQGHAGACGRDHDDVAGLQGGVFGFVAFGNEVVQVERGDGLTAALELDGAHAAVDTRAAAGKDGVDQGGQAAQVVGAGLLGLADHIDGDAAQFAQAGVDGDVFEDGGHALAQGGFEVFDLHAIERNGADFGQADLAVAVEGLAACVVGAAPELDAHFVARAEHVFAGRGGGCVCAVGRGVFKQVGTKMG